MGRYDDADDLRKANRQDPEPVPTIVGERLRERLADALATLTEMAAGPGTAADHARLTAKAEGVSLAISYVDEALR